MVPKIGFGTGHHDISQKPYFASENEKKCTFMI